jgi:hypothetical protein
MDSFPRHSPRCDLSLLQQRTFQQTFLAPLYSAEEEEGAAQEDDQSEGDAAEEEDESSTTSREVKLILAACRRADLASAAHPTEELELRPRSARRQALPHSVIPRYFANDDDDVSFLNLAKSSFDAQIAAKPNKMPRGTKELHIQLMQLTTELSAKKATRAAVIETNVRQTECARQLLRQIQEEMFKWAQEARTRNKQEAIEPWDINAVTELALANGKVAVTGKDTLLPRGLLPRKSPRPSGS